MVKKVEIYRFGTSGIPKELAERLVMPKHINQERHPLRYYVNQDLVNSDLDLILLQDLNEFYQKLIKNPPGFLSDCRGLYIAKNHVWAPHEDYEKTSEALRNEYGIEVQRALLLPMERVNYWTIIHESLHDIFNHLSQEQRKKIIQSAISYYDTSNRLHGMLDITHLNISNFDWNLDETERILDKNIRLGKSLLDGFDNFYTFGNLKSSDQLQIVDEFISNFYANDRGNNRWSESHLQSEFGKILQDIGYNMINPPEVKN